MGMKMIKEKMAAIKVESYKDCVWYLDELDKCKLPGLDGARYSGCYCKDREMDEFCVQVTKFLKATSTNTEDEEVDVHWKEYNDLVLDEEPNVFYGLKEILKKLHIIA